MSDLAPALFTPTFAHRPRCERTCMPLHRLYGNAIGDAGAAALAKALETASLQDLWLGGNRQITAAGVGALGDALKDSKLLKLGLDQCALDDAAIQRLSPGLENAGGSLISKLQVVPKYQPTATRTIHPSIRGRYVTSVSGAWLVRAHTHAQQRWSAMIVAQPNRLVHHPSSPVAAVG